MSTQEKTGKTRGQPRLFLLQVFQLHKTLINYEFGVNLYFIQNSELEYIKRDKESVSVQNRII